jgi:lipocalin
MHRCRSRADFCGHQYIKKGLGGLPLSPYDLPKCVLRVEDILSTAFNAVESYKLSEDGSIATTFRFNKGGFDGPEKIYKPRGFIEDRPSNAVWGMQFIWPFKAEYRIIYLSDDYAQTIIGRTKRDYAWIMTRTLSDP